jgi:hypothetical protein
MKKSIYAAVVAVALAGAPLAAYADGPRPSSYNNWPGMTQAAMPAAFNAVSAFDGPRTPSPHYEWQYHYTGHHPEYRGYWALVQ